MEPKDREEGKDRMSEFSGNFTHSAKGLKRSVQERFWLAQAEEAKRYLSRAQEALGIKVFRTIPSVLRGTNRESSTKRPKSGAKRKGFGDSFPPLLYSPLSTVAVDSALGPRLPLVLGPGQIKMRHPKM
ncbi:hypothetical protein EDB83DRAFT_2318785 [Lactarius deliciosus]|nr:hypothetical protein EDB83DRAFT_2318785 [Lactarius deliciosus]